MEIGYLREKGYSGRAIAHAMRRGKSSIADECVRNRTHGVYDPRKAHHKAYVGRKYAKYQGMRIVHHPPLREYVEQMLMDDLSPEAVAGRLRHLPHLPRVSSRTFIDKRPLYINTRRQVGDAEADFIASGKNGKGMLLVVVDRKTRASFLERILPATIPRMETAFLRIKGRFPELRTLTTDNDILFRHHARLAALLHVRIFFCHPYHAWEKGSIENVNKVIRRDIPKGSDLSRYPPSAFRALEAKLNRRPMNVLRYRTPSEMLARHRARKQQRPNEGCPD